jgi:acyl-CoA synthetase (AMP-forming)/AMP-acid ligase II
MAEYQATAAVPRPDHGGAFLETIAMHLRQQPLFEACIEVTPRGDGFQRRPLTLARLAGRARRFAMLLDQRGLKAGDRVLLSLSSPHHLLSCLLGAMCRGVITVPLQTAEEFRSPDLFRDRVAAVMDDCLPRLVVVQDREQWNRVMQGQRQHAPVMAADGGRAVESLVLDSRCCFPDTPAVIQYTSGSTGRPRGVVITHGNLAANARAIGISSGATLEDRVVSWLPLHHDMGLVGALLFPLFWNIPTHIMSPLAFLRRPVSWLRAVHALRGTMTVAPTFAYALCARKIPDSQLRGLDLSSLRVAFCGAEPIDPGVLEAFCRRFSPHGLPGSGVFPVYGLAEATLAVAFPTPGEEPYVDYVDREALFSQGRACPAPRGSSGAAGFVSVGRAVAGHRLKVVNPRNGEVLPERRVGEIRVRGPAVSPGYFHPRGGDAGVAGGELRTGDLGYLADGQLFVIDRLKDLLIVAGQNYSPADLERCAGATRGLRAGRVVALSLPGAEDTEELKLVAELDAASWRTQRAIREELTWRIHDYFGLNPTQVLLAPPGALPRTSSGKLRRRACRELLREGAISGKVTLGQRTAARGRRIKLALQGLFAGN